MGYTFYWSVVQVKKKFKIIDTSTGEKLKLSEGQMIVMNNLGWSKQIRLSWADIEAVVPEDYSMIRLLADRGFPVDDTFRFALKTKAGLEYFEYHDHKTGEVVVQWREEDSTENTQ